MVNEPSVSSGRKFLVGTNVAIMIVLALGAVVVAQLIAFNAPLRADMTRTGINSLSESTEKLLRDLPGKIRLTSLYFETDREEADQPKYREAARNLLALFESTNRSKITADFVNPLKDHQKYQQLITRLREKPAFKEGIDAYSARLDVFRKDLADKMQRLFQEELDKTSAATAAIDGSSTPGPLAQINVLIRRLMQELQVSRETVDSLADAATPQLAGAINELRIFYPKIARALKEVPKFAGAELARSPGMPEADAAFLREVGPRYAGLVSELEAETTKLNDLGRLEIDELLAKIMPTGNPIVLESDDTAEVIEFSSMWPPVNAGMGRATFNQRSFKGEEELAAAIVRATYKQQTAVIFVRYGGSPFFAGGFMPGQPPAPYAGIKKELEDVNFVVTEWDLKTKDSPPPLDPPPARTIYVVFKPEPPPTDPMGRPSQDTPFGESHRSTLLRAIGENGRAIFMTGWAPGPQMPMSPVPIPSGYEYSEYLQTIWGITVDTAHLLIKTVSFKPGEYQVTTQQFHFIDDVEVTDHEIVRNAQARLVSLPSSAPLKLEAPEGVELWPLIIQPRKDGVWGVKSLQTYQEQMQSRGFLTKAPGDLEGPFTLAVAGKKGDAKVVVISSRGFAEDEVAFARGFIPTAQGLALISTNPGNLSLFLNSLHWLSDNTQLLNIGKPIDAATLTIKNPSTVKTVQALTIFIWPALALAFGGVAWWVRRR